MTHRRPFEGGKLNSRPNVMGPVAQTGKEEVLVASAYTLNLKQVPAQMRSMLGGKASNLATMMEQGFQVPSAFCVTTDAFRSFLEANGLKSQASDTNPEPPTSYEQMRKAIQAGAIPDPVRRAILDSYRELGGMRVAVRSSALGEDSDLQSFAGQHDTVLGVKGEVAVLDAVKTCWASLWSDRARSYRASSGAAAAMEIALVIQRLLSPEVAGVLFTLDPVDGDKRRMVIEACLGLGEGLVSGRVTSDSVFVDSSSLETISEQIRYKVTRVGLGVDGALTLEEVPERDREVAALTTNQVKKLARIGTALKNHYGSEQDVEWAIEEGKIYLLQCRPITTKARSTTQRSPYRSIEVTPEVRDGTLWSRMDIGEIFTGMLTPLGVSFAEHYQRHVHKYTVAALGVPFPGDPPLMMGYLQGYVYLNVSYTAYLLTQSPPTRNPMLFTSRFTSEEVNLDTYKNPFGTYPGGLKLALSSVVWMRYFINELSDMKKRAQRMTARRYAEFDRHLGLALPDMTRADLSAELDRILEFFHYAHVGYMPYYINAFGFYQPFGALCRKWLGEGDSSLQNRIKTDMSNLRTVESAREVGLLAQEIRQQPEVLEVVNSGELSDVIPGLQSTAAGRRFLQHKLKPFMRENGVRAREEMELTHPRWIDDPSYVFQMIRKYVQEGLSVDDVLVRSQQARGDVTQTVLRKLPFPKRMVLGLVMGMYAECSELRELTRMTMITSIWLVRRIVYEVVRRQVEAGLLRSADEAAFVDFQSLRAWLAGRITAEQAFDRAGIQERIRTHQYHLRLPAPPLTLLGTYDHTQRIVAQDGDPYIRGLGVAPGRVEGSARVIHDLVRQAGDFRPGEVLVASFTDASWTPLFAMAGGVVTDIGSMLSHSSIVAREFNIPSVVNTRCATAKIHTGDRVVVDGDAGVVQITNKVSLPTVTLSEAVYDAQAQQCAQASL